jgi:hypothetical protein
MCYDLDSMVDLPEPQKAFQLNTRFDGYDSRVSTSIRIRQTQLYTMIMVLSSGILEPKTIQQTPIISTENPFKI